MYIHCFLARFGAGLVQHCSLSFSASAVSRDTFHPSHTLLRKRASHYYSIATRQHDSLTSFIPRFSILERMYSTQTTSASASRVYAPISPLYIFALLFPHIPTHGPVYFVRLPGVAANVGLTNLQNSPQDSSVTVALKTRAGLTKERRRNPKKRTCWCCTRASSRPGAPSREPGRRDVASPGHGLLPPGVGGGYGYAPTSSHGRTR